MPYRIGAGAKFAVNAISAADLADQLADLPLEGFGIVLETHHDRPLAGPGIQSGCRTWIQQLDSAGPCFGRVQLRQHNFKLIGWTRKCQQAMLGGARSHFERRLRDDTQGAQRTDKELAQIVARHVLDNSASCLDFPSLVIYDTDSNDVIAQSAVAVTPRAADVGCKGAADSGALGLRHINGQP